MKEKELLIINTAIRLFAKEGVGVATAKIAKKANVSNGTLFNYFETKKTLIDSVYVHIKSHMADYILNPINLEGDLYDIFSEVWLSYFKWCKKNPLEKMTLDLLKTSQILSDDIVHEGNQAWAKIHRKVEEAITKGNIMKLPDDLVCSICEGILNSSIAYVRSKNLSESEAKVIIEQSFNIFWKGVIK